jgi:hypothetical protein
MMLVTAVEAAYSVAGLIGDPTEEADRQAVRDEATQTLGGERADHARARGTAMSYDDMIQLAAGVVRSSSALS